MNQDLWNKAYQSDEGILLILINLYQYHNANRLALQLLKVILFAQLIHFDNYNDMRCLQDRLKTFLYDLLRYFL